MNKNGNPGTLVASHPGNTNAARYGAYSARLNEERANEIEQSLLQLAEFSAIQRIAIHEIASYMAILEAIDRDLAERGILDKRGEARSLFNHRARISRQLERLLDKVSPAIDRQTSDERQPAGRVDYIRELERIGLGGDSAASSRDRVSALNTLVKLDRGSSDVTHVTVNFFPDEDGNPTFRIAGMSGLKRSTTQRLPGLRRQTPARSIRRSSRPGLSSSSVSGLNRLRERTRQHREQFSSDRRSHELCVTAFCDARTAVPEETCDNLESKPEVDEM